jgi:hypothetical protein
MKKQYMTTKAFDYLNANEVYTTYAIDKTHTRFWHEANDCGTFISNWKVQDAIKSGILVEVK